MYAILLLFVMCFGRAQGFSPCTPRNPWLGNRIATIKPQRRGLERPRHCQVASLQLGGTSAGEDISDEPHTQFDDLREKLRGTCMYLVGMMGTGKSAVGTALAKRLGYRFIDSDEAAEWMIEMPIADFFAQGREAEFRELEYQVLMEMAQYTRVVVATGEGAVMQPKNWGLLRHGIVVHLDMDPTDIYTRLASGEDAKAEIEKRPLLQGEAPTDALAALCAARADMYAQADVQVKVELGEDVDTVTDKVATAILGFIADNPPFWQEKAKRREANGMMSAVAVNPSAAKEFMAEAEGSSDDQGERMPPPGIALPKSG